MGITIFVFLLQLGSKMLWGYDLPAALGLKENSLIQSGQLWRLFTPMFLHSTTLILHIVFNMYALYAFGTGLEPHYGHARFLALYLLSGFTGNVLSLLLSPAPSLGASTAVFGLLGAEGIFLYHNRRILGPRAQRALTNVIVVALINLMLGFSSGFVDNWGHIGGLVGGALLAWFGGPILDVQGVPPDLELVDRRSHAAFLRAALGVGLLFSVLATTTFFINK
jgi:rhomboid protease GluP